MFQIVVFTWGIESIMSGATLRLPLPVSLVGLLDLPRSYLPACPVLAPSYAKASAGRQDIRCVPRRGVGFLYFFKLVIHRRGFA